MATEDYSPLPRSAPPSDAPGGDVPMARPVEWPVVAEASPASPWHLGSLSRLGALVDVLILGVALVVFELASSFVLLGLVEVSTGVRAAAPDLEDAALLRRLLVPTLVVRAVGAALAIGLILRLRRQSRASVGLVGLGSVLNGAIGVGAVVVSFGLIAAFMLSMSLVWPEVAAQGEENARKLHELIPHLGPLGFAGLALLIGLYEELVFRGFLMTRLRRATGSWTLAVIISTCVFTALHAQEQTPLALVSVTILSLLFSLLTIWRRSIAPAIVAHALFDYAQFIILFSLVDWSGGPGGA